VKPKASNILAANKAAPAGHAGRGTMIGFEDANLADRSRAGDMQAFGLLVAKYQDRVLNMMCRMCGRREDAEELAQQAFLKALEKLAQFRGQSKFYTWLFRIAANLVISHRRRSSRIRFSSLEDVDGLGQSQAAGLQSGGRDESAPSAAVRHETRLRVARALDEIDDDMRLVVILRDIEQMDYAQIADVLALPLGTVKSRLHRARAALREKLADLVE